MESDYENKNILRKGRREIIGNGTNTFFWDELWNDGRQLKEVFLNNLTQDYLKRAMGEKIEEYLCWKRGRAR